MTTTVFPLQPLLLHEQRRRMLWDLRLQFACSI
jgi:hypothetical protein